MLFNVKYDVEEGRLEHVHTCPEIWDGETCQGGRRLLGSKVCVCKWESLGVLALGAGFPAAFKGNSVLTVKVCFVFKLAYKRMCHLFLFVMHQAGQVSCVVVPPPLP